MNESNETVPEELAELAASVKAFADQIRALDCKPRQIQFEIDGLMYTSTKLPTSVGLELWPRLTALLGAAITRAVATGDVSDLDAGAVLRVADRAMRDGLVPLARDLLTRMKCGKLYTSGKPGDVLGDFEEHFAGEYGHLLKVCAFAVAHNLKGPTFGVR